MRADAASERTTARIINNPNEHLLAEPVMETPANLRTPSQIEPRRVESRNTTDLNES
jgi:hypothetical protein